MVLTGNLTQDPELRHLGSGTAVCEMRIAVNTRRKEGNDWVDKPNYFNVVVWGAQGENCAQYLSKGRPVAIEGRLDWREWEAKDGSGKRQAVQIVANTVQFLGSRDGSGGGGNGGGGFSPPRSDVPADESDFASAPAGGGASQEDDIPF
ncbi:MAG TPA: single-stranded DNA-binding protein [Solirubrobacterales bacterium]|nr:single-stranded DNA-binding protein [Solirubrobacterales bacterium]